jgi:uncharacterized protein DUF4157
MHAMSIERRLRGQGSGHGGVSSDTSGRDNAGVGKRSLTEMLPPMQRKERAGSSDAPADSTAIASAGVQGGGGPLPYASQIQTAFGKHDVGGISAHVGGPAADAADQLGATAFATGHHVAFAGAPDLHTAAHEAAHVVQQRKGVSLKGGVGAIGDPYERHADAVADHVVAGQSAEALLDAGAGGHGEAIQRRELSDNAPLASPADWYKRDRERFSGSFETANLHNLAANDHTQYTRIEERRDFYHWFYNYTNAKGYTTRWALAASLVANGADQVAHMDPVMEGGGQWVGTINDELQGMMRIGNQVIFDNVFHKLNALLQRSKNGPVTGAEAVRWDMETLAEEQTLIQPLYKSVSSETIAKLDKVARIKGWAWWGAKATSGDHVKGTNNINDGKMPPFGDDNPNASITNINDRWNYGMKVAGTFSKVHDDFVPGTPMPNVSNSYTNGAELKAVDRRHNLHMLEASIDSPQDSDPQRILNLLRALTPSEQAEFNTDRTVDGTQFSHQLAECSFHITVLTSQITERNALTSALPGIIGAFTGGPGPSALLARYNAQVSTNRAAMKSTQWLPPAIPITPY